MPTISNMPGPSVGNVWQIAIRSGNTKNVMELLQQERRTKKNKRGNDGGGEDTELEDLSYNEGRWLTSSGGSSFGSQFQMEMMPSWFLLSSDRALTERGEIVTRLYDAIGTGIASTVQKLLEYGHNPNQLVRLAELNNIGCLENSGFTLPYTLCDGERDHISPLMFALDVALLHAGSEASRIVELLLRSGACTRAVYNAVDMPTYNLRLTVTPLNYIIESLEGRDKHDDQFVWEVADMAGGPPTEAIAELAAMEDCPPRLLYELIELLLAHGADPTARNNLGLLPWELARDWGRGDEVIALLKGAASSSDP